MKEHPILFSGPMIRALLDGRKTQTRRVILPQPELQRLRVNDTDTEADYKPHWLMYADSDDARKRSAWPEGEDPFWIYCPFGQPGDRLWVRETHALVPRTAYAHSDGVQQTLKPSDDHDAAIYREGWERSQGGLRWRPSIHMHRWASRITLEVTGVRVERVQAVTEANAIAEGATKREVGWSMDWSRVGALSRFAAASPIKGRDLAPLSEQDIRMATARYAYANLWELLNLKRGYGWDVNPWVWVIEFKRVEDAKAAA